MKNYNKVLTEKQQKYHQCHPEKLIEMNFIILSFDQSRIIEQAKVTYSPLGKTFEKQTKANEEQGKKIEALNIWEPVTKKINNSRYDSRKYIN